MDSQQWRQYILEGARRRGIEPGLMERVVNSEGGFKDPIRQSEVINDAGLREPSFGPFQMLVGGEGTGFPAGLGNDALQQGIDPRNPEHAQRAADFAMDTIQRDGWSRWYGARDQGITGKMGIDGRGVTLNSAPSAIGPTQAAPELPAPINVASHPVAGVMDNATAPTADATIGDKLGNSIFGDETAAKLKAAFGAGADPTNPMAAGLGMLKKSIDKKDPQAEQFIQSSGNLNDGGDAGRMQAAQQMMAALMARRKNRGLTLGGGMV